MARATRITFKGQVSHRHEADQFLSEAGAAVLVHRGVARSMAMACPDGCGENLTINLDGRAGKAWRHYTGEAGLSIFPSVWRDTGCKSHFIIWGSRIYWCDWHEELDEPAEIVLERTRAALTAEFVAYQELSDKLQIIPWAVLSACVRLCRRGLAEEGYGPKRGWFRMKQAESSTERVWIA
jgi:hypothetical protein